MLAVVDWGTGKVTDVGDAAAGDGAYCDGCDNSIITGLVYDVVLTPYGTSKPRVAVLCEAASRTSPATWTLRERRVASSWCSWSRGSYKASCRLCWWC